MPDKKAETAALRVWRVVTREVGMQGKVMGAVFLASDPHLSSRGVAAAGVRRAANSSFLRCLPPATLLQDCAQGIQTLLTN